MCHLVMIYYFLKGFACFLKPQFGGGLNQNLFQQCTVALVNLISYLISVPEENPDYRKGKKIDLFCWSYSRVDFLV